MFLLLLLLGFLWWGIQSDRGAGSSSSAERSLTPTDTEAGFTDVDGAEVSLETYLRDDAVLIVSSWASWCPFCDAQLQTLDEVAGRYPDDLSVLAINRQERPGHAQRFLRSIEELPHLIILLDPDDRFYRDIDGYTIPETVVYDTDGEVVAHFHGVVEAADIEAAFEHILR